MKITKVTTKIGEPRSHVSTELELIIDRMRSEAIKPAADKIARNAMASRLMMERVDQLILHGADLAVETTLATKSLAGVITRAQEQGYKAGIFYFWLKSPELALKRVALRVASGGHGVPEATIVRRYWQGMDNLRNLYLPICDTWVLIDNSAATGTRIAEGGIGMEPTIYNKRLYNLILNPDNTNSYDNPR